MNLREILAQEGLIKRAEEPLAYDIVMVVPYSAEDGTPLDPKWVMSLTSFGMFSDKMDLGREDLRILQRCLKEKAPPKWKGPPSPKIPGRMFFEKVPSLTTQNLLKGAKWCGVEDWITTITPS